MRRTFFHIILIFTSALFINGCGIFRIITSNIADSITESPKKIDNKISDPVRDSVKLAALWGGHSTALVQIYDKVILFDPVFNDYLAGLFMRRLENGLDYTKLSKLDMILISHSHMDHLSFSSLDNISEQFPNTTLLFPSGAEEYMPDFNLKMRRLNTENIYNGNYIGTPSYINGMKITPVYARHTGGRYGFDTYLWKKRGHTGYIVEYKDVTIYFAGDTGYDDSAFKEIGNNFNIDLSFIPIGPCRNCDSTGFKYHTSSIEGIRVLEDTKAANMIPIHYGTFQYFSSPYRPLEILKELLETAGTDNESGGQNENLKERIKILKEGQQIIIYEN